MTNIEIKEKIINNFKPLGGHHCITNSLKQIFLFNNYSISEEMLFGLGSGLGFIYLNLTQSPMISCRIKPFEFEQNIGRLLNIDIKVKNTKNRDIAIKKLINNLNNNIPVMLYVDMAYLSYLNLNESNHFGGHSIVVFGYDKEKNVDFVSDRDANNWPINTPKGKIANDYHFVPFSEMQLARNSSHRPFPANNRWLEFDFSHKKEITKEIIIVAIKKNLNDMLHPSAQLFGINGINKFSKELRKWKKFSEDKIKLAGITNYFMIHADGGTGGGAFRKIYGDFLIEASNWIPRLKIFGEKYLIIADKWENIATQMMSLYKTGNIQLIDDISKNLEIIVTEEEMVMENIIKNI
jgi:hypothetical protein